MLNAPLFRALSLSSALLLLSACGGGGGGGGGSGGGGGGGGGGTPNAAPVFTSSSSASVAENTAGAFYTATATDADGDTLTYSITGGVDAARFSITSGGALRFTAAPDFEAPNDTNTDNAYAVVIGVSDGTASATLAVGVTVTNVAGSIAVRRIATGFTLPLFLTGTGDDSDRVFVVQKGGLIRILNTSTGAIAATPFLDVTTQVSNSGERGLLGFTIAPDFTTSGVFYVFLTNADGDIEVRRYTTMAGNRDQADPASSNVILTIEHTSRDNHNGGWLSFGPDNFLYIATGDGGGVGDPDRNGQNPNVLLAKILRINPASDAFPADANRDYAIPTTNPFAVSGGAPEVWVWGVRNAFRNSFDPATGNLFIGDVGQDAVEEIDMIRPGDGGANLGWSILEGTSPYLGGSTAGLTPPVAQYPHGTGALQGNSITGGYVHRGSVTQLVGQYVFADYINDRIWSIPVSSFAVGSTLTNSSFTDRTAAFTPDAGTIANIASFGEDDDGNLYVVDLVDGEVFAVGTSE